MWSRKKSFLLSSHDPFCISLVFILPKCPSQAKVRYFRVHFAVQKDVTRFEIPVDDL